MLFVFVFIQLTLLPDVLFAQGIPFRSAYAASKHALHGFFDSLRHEVTQFGVSVTLCCPGYIQTNLSLNAVRGDGSSYGKMDETTKQGYSPQYVAAQVLTGFVHRQHYKSRFWC